MIQINNVKSPYSTNTTQYQNKLIKRL